MKEFFDVEELIEEDLEGFMEAESEVEMELPVNVLPQWKEAK